MIIRKDTTKAPKGQQTAGRGETPASQRREGNPKGVTECSCVPSVASQQSWSAVTPTGLGLHPPVYRGFTPVCALFRPSAFREGNFNQ